MTGRARESTGDDLLGEGVFLFGERGYRRPYRLERPIAKCGGDGGRDDHVHLGDACGELVSVTIESTLLYSGGEGV